jgi:rhodanese-related sulfurtransferase
MSIRTKFAQRLVILLTVLTLALAGIAGCANPAPAPQAAAQESGAEQVVNQKITPADFKATFVDGGAEHLLVDVRTAEEFATGHIPGAVNIPVQELQQRLEEIPQDTAVVLYCRSGNRSGQAASILGDAGYPEIYDLGGIVAWAGNGGQVCTGC